MPRSPRPLAPGVIYHVTARGNDGIDLFRAGADRFRYLRFVARSVDATGARVLSYCLMSNHVHLVVETPEPVLAAFMHRVNGQYARWFNAKYRRRNHLFGARYFDKVVRCQEQFGATLAYVSNNPVRAELCHRPSDWPWSAHNALLGWVTPPPFLAARRTLELVGEPHHRYAGLFV